MKLSKAQWILLALTVVFVTFTLAFFIGRGSVHAVVATERISEPVVVRETPTPEPEAPQRLDLNTAQPSELEKLPGIGEVLAQRIIDFRERIGGFISTEQLMDVEGIGELKYNDIKDLIYVEDMQ